MKNKKLKKLSSLKKIVKELRDKGKKISFANGCFDLIHPGHIKILKEAKSKGDILIVALNSDHSIKRIKGAKRPILNEKARIDIISSIGFVDYLTVFKEATPYLLIKELKPDFLIKGGDWKRDKIIGKEFVKKVYRVNTLPEYSTSSIIKKIKRI